MSWRIRVAGALIAIATALGGGFPAGAQAPPRKPNILVIFGDDIGISQVSAYTMDLMGYRTPNIDRIDREADYDKFPHQDGSSLNASGINYGMLRQTEALQRLKDVETMTRPGN
jgi:hypothetical protein